MDGSRLQPGIAFRHEQQPSPCYRLVLLNASSGATGSDVRRALADVDAMLRALAEGHVPELQGQSDKHASESAEQFAGLQHLFAFGRRLFDEECHTPALVQVQRPDMVVYLPSEGPFPALRWAGGIEGDRGEADIAIQLTADREAGVNCAAVEIWKLLQDLDSPLQIAGSYSGFGRHDGRGWLEFHDGVSNIEASHRPGALVAPADPAWMAGGTYMAFLRLSLDLAAWRSLSTVEQELIVGRDKLTGGAVLATEEDANGQICPIPAPPPGEGATDREIADYIDPPQTTDPLIEASHIHRANQNRASPTAPGAFRIYRQGYEFLDQLGPDGPRLGLNFVSFQRDLTAVQHLLHLPGWLGDVNFGGPVDPERRQPRQVPMIEVLAGGFYAVPPIGAQFPGADCLR